MISGSDRSASKNIYVINHLDWFWSHRLPLARQARRLGWEVVVAAPRAEDSTDLQAHGFRGVELAANDRRRPLATLIRNLLQVGHLLKHERPTILHAVTLKSALPAALAARWFAGAPKSVGGSGCASTSSAGLIIVGEGGEPTLEHAA